jgi:lantibiotic modifying enzyme
VLHKELYCHAALAISETIAKRSFNSPDLLNGAAGRARMHLRLAEWHGAKSHLANAREAADFLVHQWQVSGPGWQIPAGYGDLSGTTCLGYAHGAAGIASVMVEMYEATGDAVYRDIAYRVADLLISRRHDGGRTWPRTLTSDDPDGLYWCHGSAGIARFLMTVGPLDWRGNIGTIVTTVAEDLATNGMWMDASLCHGISGSVDFLVDFYLSDLVEQKGPYKGRLLDILVEAVSIEKYDDVSLMTGISGVMHVLMRSCNAKIASSSLLRWDS